MNKEEWEKSFEGYHKEAPTHLKKEASKLKDKKKEIAGKMKRGNYSIYKIEGEGADRKESRIKHNLSHADMSKSLKEDSAYRGGKGFGFGGRRTYQGKKGKESLERPKGEHNEGNTMMAAGNETDRW
jgi:hypothetical protein